MVTISWLSRLADGGEVVQVAISKKGEDVGLDFGRMSGAAFKF
jgi:hypothetical protein